MEICARQLLLIFAFIGTLHAYEIVTFPSDKVVMVGAPVTLTCTVQETGDVEYVEWREFISSPQGVRISLNNGVQHPNASRYEIVGMYNLRIKQTTFEDGGYYGCRLLLGAQSNFHYADLMVFDRPQCSRQPDISDEGDDAQVMCSVNYGGRKVPDVHFKDGNTKLPNITQYEPHSIHVTSNVTEARWRDDGKTLTCHVITEDPDHSDNCSTTLSVRYATRDTTILPDHSLVFVGEEFNCSAHGNPAPQITWEQISPPDGGVVQGTVLTVTMAMMGVRQEWRCTSSNTVQGTGYQHHTTIAFTAREQDTNSAPTLVMSHTFLTTSMLAYILYLTSYGW